ncbi:hypothetical protein LCGC14_2236030 [marine sediment metagenome]|uniref:Uncharacterized protein n=1 Tax=marine sediment metagenome TaxID=412755 RepID=A0A0F9G1X3_9ZZZZ
MIDLERLGYELYKDSDATCFGPDHPAYELYKAVWTRKARRLMEAVLGDGPYYEKEYQDIKHCVGGLDCLSGSWSGAHECRRHIGYVQVWPLTEGI